MTIQIMPIERLNQDPKLAEHFPHIVQCECETECKCEETEPKD